MFPNHGDWMPLAQSYLMAAPRSYIRMPVTVLINKYRQWTDSWLDCQTVHVARGTSLRPRVFVG